MGITERKRLYSEFNKHEKAGTPDTFLCYFNHLLQVLTILYGTDITISIYQLHFTISYLINYSRYSLEYIWMLRFFFFQVFHSTWKPHMNSFYQILPIRFFLKSEVSKTEWAYLEWLKVFSQGDLYLYKRMLKYVTSLCW